MSCVKNDRQGFFNGTLLKEKHLFFDSFNAIFHCILIICSVHILRQVNEILNLEHVPYKIKYPMVRYGNAPES